MIDLDVTITAVRRPEIFRITASSFAKNLFRENFRTRAIINIDPLGGSEADGLEVEKIACDHFDSVTVRHSRQGGFGAAVQWVWSQAQTPCVFHMEDDWLLLRRIKPETLIAEIQEEGVQAVRLYLRRNPAELYGNRLSLNPSLIRLELIKRLLLTFDTAKDPEKQHGKLPEGERIRHHGRAHAPRMVLDIGKKWRDAAGIEKRFENLESLYAPQKLTFLRQSLLRIKRDYFIHQWRLFNLLSGLRRSY